MPRADGMDIERFEPGCYYIEYHGRFFQVCTQEWHTEGESKERSWLIIELDAYRGLGIDGDGYWTHCSTYAECKDVIRQGVDEDEED